MVYVHLCWGTGVDHYVRIQVLSTAGLRIAPLVWGVGLPQEGLGPALVLWVGAACVLG